MLAMNRSAVVLRSIKLFGKDRKRGDEIDADELSKLSARHRAALEASGKVAFVKDAADLVQKPTVAAGAGASQRQRGVKHGTTNKAPR